MAGSVNKVILVGHLGKDPEVRTFDSGNRVAQFSLATSDSWTDRATNERKERTEWHNVVVRSGSGSSDGSGGGGLVGVIERYVRKGHRLFVEGQLQTRKWADRDGVDRYTTEVVVTPFSGGITLLEKPAAAPHATGREPATGRGADDMDDDVPF